eukprot:1162005-Pelagomonas_calceolata.AAC.1
MARLVEGSPKMATEVFYADIDLSSRNPSCWTSHLLFTMHGLHHAHGSQHTCLLLTMYNPLIPRLVVSHFDWRLSLLL